MKKMIFDHQCLIFNEESSQILESHILATKNSFVKILEFPLRKKIIVLSCRKKYVRQKILKILKILFVIKLNRLLNTIVSRSK